MRLFCKRPTTPPPSPKEVYDKLPKKIRKRLADLWGQDTWQADITLELFNDKDLIVLAKLGALQVSFSSSGRKHHLAPGFDLSLLSSLCALGVMEEAGW